MGSEHPEWLPLDWKVSVKIRSSGRKDKCYSHPSTGLTFYSKPEVLRYLKSSQKSSNSNLMNKMDTKKTVTENLPPGWIKEIRTKKKDGKTRRDTYYIDPVSGRQFRSMQEVFRYLESNNSGKTESKPDDEGHTSTEFVDNSQSSPAEAKGQRSIVKSGDKNETVGDSVKSGPEAAALKNVEKPLVERKDDSVAENLQNKPPQANVGAPESGGRRQSMRLANNKLKHDHSSKSGSETVVENLNILESSHPVETLQLKNPAPRKERSSRKRKWMMSNLPRRTSQRLSRLGAGQSVKDGDGASAKLSGEGGVVSTKKAGASGQSNEPETDTSAKSCTTESGEQGRAENPTNDQQKESLTHENTSELLLKSIGVVGNEDEKYHGVSLKELFKDPCIEFAIKTLTGAISIEEAMKSSDGNPASSLASSTQTSSWSPCGDIWSDPCFEFAVKTLTGEMPAEDGLQGQTSSSGGSVSASPKKA